ncbi:hypothetical protein CFN78_25815 [Amycolatopsis antarctica]|uniref:Uncharacterized protein n=1 Tax=Amycolatopsis antarctica TaxID=1854586 RepID=A0A263CW72_9PSEU|nr:hypothetical protein [Amycolatopsis antarctica]OZM70341.1 hypothetical protein CFN78_25815 [Amycolatopsis antarctica]
MSESNRSTPRRYLAVATGVLLLAGVVTATVLVSGPDEEPAAQPAPSAPPPAPSTTASSPVSSAPLDAADPEASGAALTGFLDVTDAVLGGAGTSPQDLDAAAEGFAKGEVEATMAEFTANGWRQEGTATVTEVRTVASDPGADPPTATVWACVDSSGVRIVDETGQVVSERAAGDGTRVPHLYTMVLSGDRWKAIDHTFPPEPSC